MAINTTAAWTSATAQDTTLALTIENYGAVLVTLNVTGGTLSAGQINFEASDDGVTWYAIPGLVQSSFTIFTNWQPAFGSTLSLQFSTPAFTQFRLRLNPALTGAGTVTCNISEVQSSFVVLAAAVQQFGPNLHITLDDAAGLNPVNTVVKGTQGARALAVQNLKDSGRTLKVYSATFTAATTEALVTLTPITNGTAGGTGTSFSVTAGKTFRIQSLFISTKNAGAAVQGVICNLRMTASGAVAANSPLIATVGAGTLAATANNVAAESSDIPDGLELSGTMQFGISQVGTATAGNTVTLIGYEY